MATWAVPAAETPPAFPCPVPRRERWSAACSAVRSGCSAVRSGRALAGSAAGRAATAESDHPAARPETDAARNPPRCSRARRRSSVRRSRRTAGISLQETRQSCRPHSAPTHRQQASPPAAPAPGLSAWVPEMPQNPGRWRHPGTIPSPERSAPPARSCSPVSGRVAHAQVRWAPGECSLTTPSLRVRRSPRARRRCEQSPEACRPHPDSSNAPPSSVDRPCAPAWREYG
jgi:hypothetical protein